MMVSFVRKYLRYVGLLLFAVLVWNVDYSSLKDLVRSVEARYLLLAGGFNFLFVLIKSFRWYGLLRQVKVDCSLWEALLMYQTGTYFATITPGRIGDVIKADYLKKEKGIDYSVGVVFVVLERLLDLFVLLISFTLLSFCLHSGESLFIPITLLTGGVMFILLTFLLRNQLRFLFKVVVKLPLLGKWFEAKEQHFVKSKDMFGRLLRPGLVISVSLSLLSYLCLYAGGLAIADGMRLPLSFMQVSYCMATANLVSLLPVSIAGIGTRDAALVVLFSSFGIAKEAALFFSFSYLIINLFFSHLVGCLLFHLGVYPPQRLQE